MEFYHYRSQSLPSSSSSPPILTNLAERVRNTSNFTVSAIISSLFSAILVFFFALVGTLLGAMTGALIGQETESGFIRGAAIGAISGAVFSLEVFESSVALWRSDETGIGCLLYLIDVIASLLSGRLVRERIGPAMLSAVQSQMGAMESSFEEVASLFETETTKGLPCDIVERIPKIKITSNNNADASGEKASCSVCLQDFQIGETVRSLPQCHHMFHLPCIDKWLGFSGADFVEASGELAPPPRFRRVGPDNWIGVLPQRCARKQNSERLIPRSFLEKMKRATVEDGESRALVECRRSSRLSPSLSSSIPDLGGVVEDGLPPIAEVGESIEAEDGDGDSSEMMVTPLEEVGDCLRGEVAGLRGQSILPDLSPISELSSMGRGSRPSISRSPSFSLGDADRFCQNAMDAGEDASVGGCEDFSRVASLAAGRGLRMVKGGVNGQDGDVVSTVLCGMNSAGFGSSLPTGTVSPGSASVIPLGGEDQTAAIGASEGLRDGDGASSGAPLQAAIGVVLNSMDAGSGLRMTIPLDSGEVRQKVGYTADPGVDAWQLTLPTDLDCSCLPSVPTVPSCSLLSIVDTRLEREEVRVSPTARGALRPQPTDRL
ncbi:hypothetical protein Dimus_014053 [Dionaea muscipula]